MTDPTHDPLRVLTDGYRAVEPDPAFAARLRETLATLPSASSGRAKVPTSA